MSEKSRLDNDQAAPGLDFLREIFTHVRKVGAEGQQIAAVLSDQAGRLEASKLRSLERDRAARVTKLGADAPAIRSLDERIASQRRMLVVVEAVRAQASATRPKTGTDEAALYGRVVAADGGKPVAGAQVIAEGVACDKVGEDQTDDNGRFSFHICMPPEGRSKEGEEKSPVGAATEAGSVRVRLTVRDAKGGARYRDDEWQTLRMGHATYREISVDGGAAKGGAEKRAKEDPAARPRPVRFPLRAE